MRMIVALGTALVLGSLGALSTVAHAQNPRQRPLIRVPVVTPTPYWDYNIIPRYRYRPEDDRVDPCGGPIVPVIRYGPQEATVPWWLARAMGYPLVVGRDWPCRGQHR